MTDKKSAYDLHEMEEQIRKEWDALSDEDLAGIQGGYKGLTESIEKRYGVSHEVAKRQVEEWKRRFE